MKRKFKASATERALRSPGQREPWTAWVSCGGGERVHTRHGGHLPLARTLGAREGSVRPHAE